MILVLDDFQYQLMMFCVIGWSFAVKSRKGNWLQYFVWFLLRNPNGKISNASYDCKVCFLFHSRNNKNIEFKSTRIFLRVIDDTFLQNIINGDEFGIKCTTWRRRRDRNHSSGKPKVHQSSRNSMLVLIRFQDRVDVLILFHGFVHYEYLP